MDELVGKDFNCWDIDSTHAVHCHQNMLRRITMNETKHTLGVTEIVTKKYLESLFASRKEALDKAEIVEEKLEQIQKIAQEICQGCNDEHCEKDWPRTECGTGQILEIIENFVAKTT